MVCTKCGVELKDTDLFCLKCGAEVQIVPDYNPVEEIVIQNLALAQQNEIISQNTKETQSDTKKIETKKVRKEEKVSSLHKKKTKRKTFLTFPRFASIVVICVFIAFFLWNKHKNSFAYQYEKAQVYLSNENYQDALEYLNKALLIKDNDVDVLYLMAKAYIGLNKIDDAISYLKEALVLDSNNEKAAKQLIEIYSDYNYTDELNAFVSDIKDTQLAKGLGDFYLNRPLFSIESGTYDKFISVELKTNTQNDIYYTVDGTKPTTQAIKYSGQIRLRGGTTIVRAVAVNEAGEYSIENIQEYTVHSTVPDNPVIKPASGTYTSPSPIHITIPDNCKVYYTLDGSTPNETSFLYTKPLDMPLGKHTLSVVAIDENGIVSNTIQSNYDLQFDAVFTVDQAHDIIVQRLGEELIDEKGAFTLECESAIEIGGYNLYSFEKVYGRDANGNKICGSEKYAFDVLTAETYYAVTNVAGGYDLTPF
ncbi:chitobiase/beta-hexosaminidase C-terminal domain-containing protein [Candidatus Galacturonibacter soehngenii]|nr:chitobiase/beta-hexosaminidase C-terminal domain-containing protein [Candidatus Galacturonibacter soehngenii]MBA4685947.1 chitobiase/beta-hexosaminidase C-terminal domain-containing protein [Candidatus Galacturonibacter soehngenii]